MLTRRKFLLARFAAATALALTGVCCVAAASEADGFTLHTVSYNIHGIHRLIARDSPKQRAPRIGSLIAERYDLALLQEDFEYPRRLERTLGTRPYVYFRGNGSAVEAGFSQRLAQILFWLPAKLLMRSEMPQGSGLTTVLYPREGLTAEPLVRQAYRVCEGILWGKSDCLAAKGFLGVRLSGPGGIEVDVYNTHLDSRGNLANREIRRRQLRQLADAIRDHSAGRALIVAGDFNTRDQRPNDRVVLEEFRAALGLANSGARRNAQRGQAIDTDYILYRSGETARIELAPGGESAGEAGEFRWDEGRRPLSDHPALYGIFRVSAPQKPRPDAG